VGFEDILKFRTSNSKVIIKKSKKREKRKEKARPQSHTIRFSKLLGLRLASDKRANYTHCKISERTLTRGSDKKSARIANFAICRGFKPDQRTARFAVIRSFTGGKLRWIAAINGRNERLKENLRLSPSLESPVYID